MNSVIRMAAITAALLAPLGIGGPRAAEPGFVYRCGAELCLDGKTFRFVSFNAPELSMRENPYWDVEHPFDQEDIIRTVAEFGGRVTRTYVLSVAGTGKDPVHVTGPGTYGQEAFQSLDRVLAFANQHDVKVIIPFIDTWEWWGGIPQFAALHGLTADEFYTSEVTKQAYKDLVSFVLNRKNTITGTLYKEDPAILAWETGNELRKAPAEWTMEMAAFIKSIDPNHMVIDGNDEHHDARVLDDPNIDVLSRHYYGSDFAARYNADLDWAAGKRPIIVEEYGLASFDEIRGIVDAVVEKGVGALIWSLRNHDSLGAWHWHCEAGGTCAYHWPGFASGNGYRERDVIKLLHDAAWAIRGERAAPPRAPDVPTMLPVATPLNIRWLGVVGADRYDIARSDDDGASWTVVGADIPDSVNTASSRIRRTIEDPQSGRTHEETLLRVVFQDLTATADRPVLYRVRAKGPGGESVWSEPMPATLTLSEGVRFMTDDQIDGFRTVARFNEVGTIRRVELWTDADAFATDNACWPQVVSKKKRLEMVVIDAPEINPNGAVLVSAEDADFGTEFAIAQPCRGQVNILAGRYALGSYDLDSPTLPERELPLDVIDQFETYSDLAASGFAEKWKPHPGGNATSFEVTSEGSGSPHLAVTYELGTPNYSGVQRFLMRDNWRQFEGLSFRYRGRGGANGLTVQFRADSGFWETSVPAPSAEWTEVRIPFTDFHEPPWDSQGDEFGVTGVVEFNLYVGGSSGGTYEIDDITLYPKVE